MLFKIFLMTIIPLIFFILALGLKKYLKPKAELKDQSCDLGEFESEDETCGSCQIKEIANCAKTDKEK